MKERLIKWGDYFLHHLLDIIERILFFTKMRLGIKITEHSVSKK